MVSHLPMDHDPIGGASPQRRSPVLQSTPVSRPVVSLPPASPPGIKPPHHIDMPPGPVMIQPQQMAPRITPQVKSPRDMPRVLQPPIEVPTPHAPDVKYPLAYTSPNSAGLSPNINAFAGGAYAANTPLSEAPPSISSTRSTEMGDPAASSEEEDDMTNDMGELQLTSHDLPDMSYVNRIPPALDPPRSVPFSTSITTGALFGEKLVIASQDKMRVLVVRRGAQFHTEVPEQSTEVIVPQTAEHYALLDSPSNLSPTSRDLRATALAFCPSVQVGTELVPEGRIVWYGTPAGHIGELDTLTGKITALRTNVHKSPVCHVARIGKAMVCVDESGKISTWVPRSSPLHLPSTTPETIRITIPKNTYLSVEGSLLWLCTPTMVTKMAPKQTQKVLSVRCYSPVSDTRPFNVMSQAGQWPMSGPDGGGAVTCSASLSTTPGLVYFGHESGHITVWNEQGECIEHVLVSSSPIMSMAGVLNAIWSGTRDGRMIVHMANSQHLRMVKLWQGHRDSVFSLLFDGYGINTQAPEYMACSLSTDNYATFWDATLSQDWINAEVNSKADLYSTSSSLRALMMTYNLDAAAPADLFGMVDNMDLFQRILRSSCTTTQNPDGSSSQIPPDVIVFSFQELVDLEDKRQTAKRFLLGGSRQRRGTGKESTEERERLPSRYRAWLDKLMAYVRLVMPPELPFSVLLTENLVGLFTCIFVRSDLLPRIRLPGSYAVKTGLGGRYGNKGALLTRFVLDDTSLCFINCHLAAGQRNVRRRNLDVADILQSSSPTLTSNDLAFALGSDGSMAMDHEICLLAGDLNYRLDLSRETAMTLIEQNRFADLFAADQLQLEIRSNPQFGLRHFLEAPICFAPTYKFDRLTNDYDSSDKARVPAYCDRILYRSRTGNMVQCTSYKRWDATVSDHRPVSATFSMRVKSVDRNTWKQVADHTVTEFLHYRAQLLRTTSEYYHCI